MKNPSSYVYPVVFTYEDDQISITFPDFPGCVSAADTEAEAFANAREALGGHIWCMEQDHDPIPEPTPINAVPLEPGEVVSLLEVFMPAVRMAQENRSISRTVTLPAWLNARALEKGVNFSQVLQEALRSKLGA
ncbi:MAG: type II toxin-antitoxin system HicB family antitoxin [Clostridia bacterium]|nr:type II toxin-antitoxin system HicB family antitoxin [Clostridia bacterium]